MPGFSKTSEDRLATCDQRLQFLMHRAIQRSPIDFMVLCGFRDKEEQEASFAAGTTTLHWPFGKHNRIPSLAVDIAPVHVTDGHTVIDWNDEKSFEFLAHYVLGIAHALDLQVTWGGNWKRPHDMPHFEVKEI